MSSSPSHTSIKSATPVKITYDFFLAKREKVGVLPHIVGILKLEIGGPVVNSLNPDPQVLNPFLGREVHVLDFIPTDKARKLKEDKLIETILPPNKYNFEDVLMIFRTYEIGYQLDPNESSWIEISNQSDGGEK